MSLFGTYSYKKGNIALNPFGITAWEVVLKLCSESLPASHE